MRHPPATRIPTPQAVASSLNKKGLVTDRSDTAIRAHYHKMEEAGGPERAASGKKASGGSHASPAKSAATQGGSSVGRGISWSEEEAEELKKLAETHTKTWRGDEIPDFDAIASALTAAGYEERTATACRAKYKKLME